MTKLIGLTAAIAAMFTVQVSAADNTSDARYFTIAQTVIEEISDKGGSIPGSTTTPTIPSPGDLPKPPSGPVINPGGVNPNGQPSGPLNGEINANIDTLDRIVNLVDKIMTIIAKNQPVVNLNVNYANAVPFGTSHWTQLQGWSRPSTKRYAFKMINGFNSEVVKVVYQVHWTHSGNFNGVGKFLTGVTVEPLSVTTAWGYNVDLTAEVPDSTVANVGTTANPIASMQVQLKWKVHTIIKDIQQKAIYYVDGTGFMEQIATPFESGVSVSPQKMERLESQLTNVRFN